MKIMYDRKIRRVILTEGDNLVGVVTEHDIFKLLMNNKDLLSNVIEDSVPIPRNQVIKDLSHFWFDNTLFLNNNNFIFSSKFYFFILYLYY